jgi:Uma2 family endonuclease
MTIAHQERIKMTAEQYLQLGEDPPGVRLELVNGEIIVSASPTTSHAFAISQLLRLLGNHIASHELGVLMSDTDHVLTIYDVRRPDVYYFSSGRVHLIGEGPIRHAPDLAVEIISPGSEKADRIDKFNAYRSFGIAHYWIIDPKARTAAAYKLRRSRYVLVEMGSHDAEISFPPFEDFRISLRDLWWPPRK